MLSSGSVSYPLTVFVILWARMLSSGKVCYPLGPYFILWKDMLSSGSVSYPLSLYVILWIGMLSSGSKRSSLTVYVILWEGTFYSGSVCYPLGLCYTLTVYVIRWARIVILLILYVSCYHLVSSSNVVIWDDNIYLFYFSQYFSHSNFCMLRVLTVCGRIESLCCIIYFARSWSHTWCSSALLVPGT
jgi:hypothetical protein